MHKYLKDIFIFIFFVELGCILGFLYFDLPDWDFYSYHYYNGWAFLNDRLNTDFLPCMHRSYFNPLLDSVMYLCINKLNNHPLIFITLSGSKYGILMFLAYKIYHYIFEKIGFKDTFSILFCIIMAGASPIILFCIGFDKLDIQISVIALLGFYIYLKNIFLTDIGKKRLIMMFISAFLIGCSVGLKYVSISFAAAIVLTTLFMYKKIFQPIKVLITILFGLSCGLFTTGGYWMYILYEKFQNPFFPYFNNVFKSTKCTIQSFLTEDFIHLRPKSIIEYILYPLRNTAGQKIFGLEYKYYDFKIPLSFICVISSLIILNLKKMLNKTFMNKNYINIFYLLLYFIAFSYCINLLLFANMRYIIYLFILSPVIVCLLFRMVLKDKYYIAVLCVILSIFIFTRKDGQVREKLPWMAPEQILNISNLNFEDNSLIICGNSLACFIAPNQNKKVKYFGFNIPQNISDNLPYITYLSDYSGEMIKENYLQNNNVYFIYHTRVNKDVYEKILKNYIDKNIALNNCKTVEHCSYGYCDQPHFELCKIK